MIETKRVRHAGNDFEVTAIKAPRIVMREVVHVFKSKGLSLDDHVIVIPTCQKSCVDLVNWGDAAAVEKDRLLETFEAFATDLGTKLEGHWCDFIDPCSGLPKHTDAASVYDEVASMQSLLKYEISQAGPCKVLMHPRWGAAVYPATIFTTAPADVVATALAAYSPTS